MAILSLTLSLFWKKKNFWELTQTLKIFQVNKIFFYQSEKEVNLTEIVENGQIKETSIWMGFLKLKVWNF